RHAGFRVESERLYDCIFVYIDDGKGLAIGVGDIYLTERRREYASVWLVGRGKALNHRHRLQIDDTDLVFSPVGSIDLVQAGHVFQPGYAGNSCYCLHELVGSHVDNVQNAWTKMRR